MQTLTLGTGTLARQMGRDFPLDETLNYVVSQAGRLFDGEAIAIYRLWPETNALTVEAARGMKGNHAPYSGVLLGQGAVSQAVFSRQPVAVSDISDVPHGDHIDPQQRPPTSQPYRSLLAIPLIIEGLVYGAIVLYYTRPRQFSDSNLTLAVAFAEQIALAIENARLRAEAEQGALAAERNRLARELHEAVTQALFSSSIIADILPCLYERDPQEGKKRLAELRNAVKGALSEMRVLLLELRPRALAEMRLGDLLQELANALGGRIRASIQLSVEGDRSLPLNVRIAFYRIAQEALSNIAHHADAGHVTIHLSLQPERCEMTIHDDGQGFDAQNAPRARGIDAMRERAKAIGATLRIESKPGSGTTVTLRWNEPSSRSAHN
jgi:signal transduction histidine kinase